MIFNQLFESETSTYTYLLADASTREAVLVDPVVEHVERYLSLLERLGLRLVYTLETHVHADHVSGGASLRDKLGSRTVVHAEAGAECADVKVQDGDVLEVGSLRIEVLYTPGHTNGDVSYRVGDRVLTGDALMIGGCGRTDFQQGDAARLYDSVTQKLFTLPEDTLVFPGHDYRGNTVSTIGHEKRENPRLGGGRTKNEFVQIMAQLNLAYPKRMARSVPANLQCGRELAVLDALEASSSGSRYGFREMGPQSASTVLQNLKLVDVREPYEFNDALGHIPGAQLHPLAGIRGAASGWDREAPVLVICRSGGRSGQAAMALLDMGFRHVFNLTGGMLGWNDERLPVEREGSGAHA